MRFLDLTPKNGNDALSAGRSKAEKSGDLSDNRSNDEVIGSSRITPPGCSKPWSKNSRLVNLESTSRLPRLLTAILLVHRSVTQAGDVNQVENWLHALLSAILNIRLAEIFPRAQ